MTNHGNPLIQRAFSRAATTYDEAAVLQRHVGTALVNRLESMHTSPLRILEIGCATGFCTQLLREKYPTAHITALDIALPMLKFAEKKLNFDNKISYLCANADNIPFSEQSFDLIISNLTLQWLSNLPTLFAQCRQLLQPGGYLLMTTFGPQTLYELRASWTAVDSHQHVNDFTSIQMLGDQLLRAGFQDPVVDVDDVVIRYRELATLFKDLKQLGANNHNTGRPKSLTGKRKWQQVNDNYLQYREISGHFPATYQVVFLHGYAGELPIKKMDSKEASFPISELRRRVLGE